MHQACPKIEETMKWSHPAFGCRGIVAGIATFTEHLRFRFWKGSLMKNQAQIFRSGHNDEKIRLRSLDDLAPHARIVSCVQEAVQLNTSSQKVTQPTNRIPRPVLQTPEYFLAALRR